MWSKIDCAKIIQKNSEHHTFDLVDRLKKLTRRAIAVDHSQSTRVTAEIKAVSRTDRSCQLYIIYDLVPARAQLRIRVDPIGFILRKLIPETSSEAFTVRCQCSDNWVSKATRHLAIRAALRFSSQAQGHRKEWLPPS